MPKGQRAKDFKPGDAVEFSSGSTKPTRFGSVVKVIPASCQAGCVKIKPYDGRPTVTRRLQHVWKV